VHQQVIYLAVHLTSCRKVTHAFNRQHGEYASVGKSWVAEFIKERACEIAERRRAMRRQRPAFFEVGHTWALDLTFVVSPNGFTFTVLGILHRRGPPGQPWRNGRIERLFGTLKPLLHKIRPTGMAVLQNALTGFCRFYNQVRPHQNLGGLTPAEAWQGKSLADVQQAHTQAQGQWVQALDGLLMGYHIRC